MEKQNLNFRLLERNEIDCRISTINKNGLSLLLYKDARVDQNILDETVGPMRWKRSHELIGDRLYCTVSIRDEETGEWISKQDVGTESYTEKEKGQASDSFKRACFNWGIGRELYTAPFIWIPFDKCEIKEKNGKLSCYDDFRVKEIEYNDKRVIKKLVIIGKGKRVVFALGYRDADDYEDEQEEIETDPNKVKVEAVHVNTLFMELARTGVGKNRLLEKYGLSDLHDMNMVQFADAMEVLKGKPDKVQATAPPESADDPSLPWNTPSR